MATEADLIRSIQEVAIPSLRWCEERYGHDDQARLNMEAAIADEETVSVMVLWARIQDDRYAPWYIAAWASGMVDSWPELVDDQRAKAEELAKAMEPEIECFLTTYERLPRPLARQRG